MGRLYALLGLPDGTPPSDVLAKMVSDIEAPEISLETKKRFTWLTDNNASAFSSRGNIFVVDGYINHLTSDGISYSREKSEAENISANWDEHGERIFTLLDGEFAILIYLHELDQLLIGTSATGSQPLYYSITGDNCLAVATEIRPLLSIRDNSPSLSPESLIEYIAFRESISDPEATYYADIRRIEPGHVYRFKTNFISPDKSAYWTPESHSHHLASADIHDYAQELETCLSRAIEGSLSDQPTTLGLSGGLDSGAIWAVLQDLANHGHTTAADVHALSKVFPGHACDESELINATARHTGKPPVLLDLTDLKASDHTKCLLERLDYMPEPNAFQLCVYLQHLQSQQNQVLLMGIGGDEWLSCSLNYLADMWRNGQRLTAISRALRYQSWDAKPWSTGSLRRIWRYAIAPQGSAARHYFSMLRAAVPPFWINPKQRDFYLACAAQRGKKEKETSYSQQRLNNILHWHRSYGMLPYKQLARSFGQEVRFPLMSRKLAEFAFHTPAHLFSYLGKKEKELLRLALKDKFAPQLLEREYPTTFEAFDIHDRHFAENIGPAKTWLTAEMGIIDPGAVEKAHLHVRSSTTQATTLIRLYWAELFSRSLAG